MCDGDRRQSREPRSTRAGACPGPGIQETQARPRRMLGPLWRCAYDESRVVHVRAPGKFTGRTSMLRVMLLAPGATWRSGGRMEDGGKRVGKGVTAAFTVAVSSLRASRIFRRIGRSCTCRQQAGGGHARWTSALGGPAGVLVARSPHPPLACRSYSGKRKEIYGSWDAPETDRPRPLAEGSRAAGLELSRMYPANLVGL